MTLSVIVIVTISIFIILGYSYNGKDGRLEQGGLLQFASIPSGAAVALDGTTLSSRTPNKISVDATNHFVTMTREGYRPWQKSITVQPGGIGWLSYARLVPTTLTPESLHTFTGLTASLASHDRKWLAVQEDAARPGVTLVDITSATPKYVTVTIPETILTEPTAPSLYTMVEWNADNNRLLVKRVYNTDHVEWLLLDRTNGEASENITKAAGLNLTDVKIGSANGRELYVKTDDNVIRRLRLDNDAALSAPLAERVSEYSVIGGSTVVYVATVPTNEVTVGYRTSGMDAAQTLFTLPAGTQGAHVALSSYFGVIYVTVTSNQTMTTYRGTLPKPEDTKVTPLKKVTEVALKVPAHTLRVSSNGRFVVAGQPDGYTTYDIELKKTDTTTFERPAQAVRPQLWLDDFLAASDRAGTLRLAEFDGANQQDIMPVIEGQAVMASSDNVYLYGFANVANNGPSLVRVRMIAN